MKTRTKEKEIDLITNYYAKKEERDQLKTAILNLIEKYSRKNGEK